MPERPGHHYSALLLLLGAVVLVAIVFSTGMGYMTIRPLAILQIIGAKLFGNAEWLAGLEKTAPYIVIDVRLPRILTAVWVGAGLALSGVIFQGILLNPLADPYTLGVSSGAAFGASLSLLANMTLYSHFSTPVAAFLGAVLTLFVVMRLSTFNGQISPQTLILSGVIVGAILAAGISFLKYIAGEQVSIIIFWLMGSFAASTWSGVLLVTGAVVFEMLVAFYFSRDLNIMSLGRRSSDSLGVNTVKVRKILLITASLATAICVAVSGIIGFIGLIIPHLMRYLVGPDNRKLIPVSALAGSILLLCADTLTRAILPVEVPIGVLTALIGGPFFCIIFRQKQRVRSYE